MVIRHHVKQTIAQGTKWLSEWYDLALRVLKTKVSESEPCVTHREEYPGPSWPASIGTTCGYQILRRVSRP